MHARSLSVATKLSTRLQPLMPSWSCSSFVICTAARIMVPLIRCYRRTRAVRALLTCAGRTRTICVSWTLSIYALRPRPRPTPSRCTAPEVAARRNSAYRPSPPLRRHQCRPLTCPCERRIPRLRSYLMRLRAFTLPRSSRTLRLSKPMPLLKSRLSSTLPTRAANSSPSHCRLWPGWCCRTIV